MYMYQLKLKTVPLIYLVCDAENSGISSCENVKFVGIGFALQSTQKSSQLHWMSFQA